MLGFVWSTGLVLAPLVIVVFSLDLMRGCASALPNAPLFVALSIVILLAYVAMLALLLAPILLAVLPHAILGALLIGYLLLGAAQASAIAAGREVEGYTLRQVYLGMLMAYVPIVGSAMAVRWARVGWSWRTATGVARFFGPLAAILGPVLWVSLLFLGPRHF